MAATLTDQGDRFPNLETVMAHSDPTTVGGKLNPMWVKWLMGWPLEWTDLKPLEMDKFRLWQQQHGGS
jgi:DNA (cytosine-5)-methyltransferase 1